MTDYNVGDLVEIKKGEVVVRDRLAESSFRLGQLYLPSHNPQTYINALPDWGWTVTVIEKAAPKIILPTEPGWYLDRADDVWFLDSRGKLTCLEAPDQNYDPEGWTPFTRLEPVANTAAKVIADVRGIFGGPGALLHKDVDKIAERYGVSS